MREVHIFPHIHENLAFGADNFPLGNEAFTSPQIRRNDLDRQYVNFREIFHMPGILAFQISHHI